MTNQPSEDNILFDTLERFVRERLIPREAELEETDQVPEDILQAMRELGMYGLSIPEEYGGLSLSVTDEVKVNFLFGQASPAFRSAFGTTTGIGSLGITLDGTEDQKRKYLPKLATGESTASFALTEPEAGSDAGSIRTTARADGSDYIINGTKRFITNAPTAAVFTVMARTGTTEDRSKGVTAFLVDAGTPGLTIGKPNKKMGQRGAHVADVMFDNLRVSADQIVGGPARLNKGFSTVHRVLTRGRLVIAALCVGMAERLLAESVAYAKQRKQFGQPIAEFQLIQAMLADSRAESFAGRAMTLQAAQMFDAGNPDEEAASCCKLFCSEMVGRVADRAVQIFGGAGYMAETPIEHLYRDARLYRIYEGTTQIQQLLIARKLLARS